MWNLWLFWNSVVFGNELGNNVSVLDHRRSRVVWVPPTQGWFKLNSDGAHRASDGRASCGCVIRDNFGNWIVGFAKFIGDEFDLQGALGIVAHIRDMYDRDWQVVLQHVRREGNKVADAMTRLSMDEELVVSLYYDPPVSLEQLLLVDYAAYSKHPEVKYRITNCGAALVVSSGWGKWCKPYAVKLDPKRRMNVVMLNR
ncbi:hypothetical protein V6N12_030965 [Hibiscus sabdariffa]|uniref:RNase H type-1 domain-containing protein n=1 Tax=Hibiscus sabdariffa TaxID=183260 RepID=A0ABR2E7J7_9ROSI